MRAGLASREMQHPLIQQVRETLSQEDWTVLHLDLTGPRGADLQALVMLEPSPERSAHLPALLAAWKGGPQCPPIFVLTAGPLDAILGALTGTADDLLSTDASPTLLAFRLKRFLDQASRSRHRAASSPGQPVPRAELSHQLLQTDRVGILAFDKALRYTEWNPGMERLTGLPRAAVIGQPALDLFPFLRATGQERIYRSVLEGKTLTVEPRRFSMPGTQRDGFFASSYQPLFGPDGQVLGGLGLAVDVTELQVSRDVLRSQEELLSHLFNALDDVVWSFSVRERRLVALSAAVERVYGRPGPAFFDDPRLWLEVVHPEDRPRAADLTTRVLKEGSISDEHRILHASGQVRWIRYRARAVYDAQGQAERIEGIISDITSAKEAELVIQHARDFLKQVIDTVADPIFVKDEDHRWIEGNSAFWAFMNRRPEELLGQSDYDFFPKYQADIFWQRDQRVMDSLQPDINEEELTDFEGTIRTLSTKKSVFVSSTGRKVLVGVIRDITELKALQRALITARDAALEASRTKSRFLASMSHEIRTPLNAIVGMSNLALETCLTPEQREYLSIVKSSAEQMLEIIDDLLDISRLEAGKVELNLETFSLPLLVADTLRTLAPRAHLRGLEIFGRVSPAVPEQVLGDPVRLRQILMNLLGNAIKFTERGEVRLEVVPAPRPDCPGRLSLSVVDTGAGIPPEQQERIFQPFIQADGSNKRRHGGTGLGLAISAQLTELMGGTLEVQSRPGEGSTFTLSACLPPQESREASGVLELMGRHLLLLDEHPRHRETLKEQLEALGLRVSVVPFGSDPDGSREAPPAGAPAASSPLPQAPSDGEDPLSHWLRNLPEEAGRADLLLLNHAMPDLEAPNVLRRLRTQPALAEIPGVVLCTASAAPHLRQLLASLGLHWTLRPTGRQELAQALLAALRRLPPPPVESPPEEGTTLPTLRVLVAEDNPVNAQLMRLLLGRMGHEVEVAEDGHQALDALEASHFDVVLMDMQMPDMDGLEATRQLRARERDRGSRLPVIAVTANAMKGDDALCLSAGMDGYLSKPFTVGQLQAELARVLGSGRSEQVVSVPTRVFDPRAALARADGDVEIHLAVLGLFLREVPVVVRRCRQHWEAQQVLELEKSAHWLKSAYQNVGSSVGVELASTVEERARGGSLRVEAELRALDGLQATLEKVIQARVLALQASEGAP